MTENEFSDSIISLRPTLRRFARCFVDNPNDIDDLVQDTYLKALRNRDKFANDTNLAAWLQTILKNQFINSYRRKKKFIEKVGDPLLVDPEIKIKCIEDLTPDSILQHKELSEIVNGISEGNRLPFNMHIEGYKYEEIAEKMHLPIGTVKSRIFMARKEAIEIIYGIKSPKPHKMDLTVKKFRELCKILKEKYGYTGNQIIIESKLVWPTYKKITEFDENAKRKPNFQSHTVDLLKSFVEKHKDKFHELSTRSDENSLTPHPGQEGKKKEKESESGKESEFWQLLEKARKIKPVNVTLQILIK